MNIMDQLRKKQQKKQKQDQMYENPLKKKLGTQWEAWLDEYFEELATEELKSE